MSKFALLFIATAVFGVSCTKDNTRQTDAPKEISVTGATVIKEGEIFFTGKPNSSGNVIIYRKPDATFILGLEKIEYSSDTDLELFFSLSPDKTSSSIRIFSFDAIDGTLYHELPHNLNFDNFQFIIIRDERLHTTVATAKLS